MAFLTERNEEECNDLRRKVYPVLDQGSVALVDWMGSDQSICHGARISYGLTEEKQKNDRELLRMLMRHLHTSPFELACVQFYIKAPMDVFRQLIRHRTGAVVYCSVNEYSTRYKEAIDARQETPPDAWRMQATSNKQGSGGYIEDKEIGEFLSKREKEQHEFSMEVYQERLKAGVAREQARKDLPLSTYTEGMVRFDLHNLLHFLRLRMDPHAQLEIRQYANQIGFLVSRLFPESYCAWEDYVKESLTFSSHEQHLLQALFRRACANALHDEWPHLVPEHVEELAKQTESELTQRELIEFTAKLKQLNFLPED